MFCKELRKRMGGGGGRGGVHTDRSSSLSPILIGVREKSLQQHSQVPKLYLQLNTVVKGHL